MVNRATVVEEVTTHPSAVSEMCSAMLVERRATLSRHAEARARSPVLPVVSNLRGKLST